MLFSAVLFVIVSRIMGESLEKFSVDKVVPDVIDEVPAQRVEVLYALNVKVLFGNELTPTKVKDQPSIIWNGDEKLFYTLAMVDPDAPSKESPKFREVKHWLVGNIKGNDISTGEVIADYLGSGPPQGTGLHRYIFLVYKQPGKLDYSSEPKTSSLSRANRLNFNIRKFADKYKLGEAFAGNFFKAQWDPYVEIRNKNITND